MCVVSVQCKYFYRFFHQGVNGGWVLYCPRKTGIKKSKMKEWFLVAYLAFVLF